MTIQTSDSKLNSTLVISWQLEPFNLTKVELIADNQLNKSCFRCVNQEYFDPPNEITSTLYFTKVTSPLNISTEPSRNSISANQPKTEGFILCPW